MVWLGIEDRCHLDSQVISQGRVSESGKENKESFIRTRGRTGRVRVGAYNCLPAGLVITFKF